MEIQTECADAPAYTRDSSLARATLINRPNRFLGVARLDSGIREACADEAELCVVRAHIADPGRLEELLFPGAVVYLSKARAGNRREPRKTEYDLVLVEHDGILVSVDSRVPNELIHNALKSGFFEELREYRRITRESTYGSSRFDFRLSTVDAEESGVVPAVGAPDCFVEVKSVTLVRDDVALFPDAPTARGARHMRELATAVSQGFRAMVVFVIQREDAEYFAPNSAMDPEFAEALRAAICANVEVTAVKCSIAESGAITLCEAVPVSLRNSTPHPEQPNA